MVEVVDDDTMTIERKLFSILIKSIQSSYKNCGISQKVQEFQEFGKNQIFDKIPVKTMKLPKQFRQFSLPPFWKEK